MMQSKTTHTVRNHPHRRRRAPKPAELVVVAILLTLICILGYILTTGFIASLNSGSAHAAVPQADKTGEQLLTATPFQPDQEGAVIVNPDASTASPVVETTPTERVWQKPEGQINFLLLGSDLRPNEGGFRTDVILWVSLNPKEDFVSIISFPRDLFVYIPGYGENRINVAFPYGGFNLLADTFEENFGVRPDHYVLVDFYGFKRVIDDLGGINVQTAQNLSDTCARWVNPSGFCSVGPGLVHMDGETALWYARSRYSTSDIDRSRRAQEVGEAIFQRVVSLNGLIRAPELYNAYINYVDTDLRVTDVITLLPFASTINENGDIRNYVVGYEHAYDWITTSGAQVLVPDYAAIRALMIEALHLQ